MPGLKPEPLKYKEVEMEMRQLAKTLPVGAKLPPERHLAITYHCNFLTVRKALKSLVEDGLIIRRIGSGTFVADPGKRVAGTVRGGVGRPKAAEKRVGLLVFHKSNAYAHKLLQSIAHVAMEEGILLRSSWIRDFGEEGLRQARALADDGCSALVLPWFPQTMREEMKNLAAKCPVPISLSLVIPGMEKNFFGRAEQFGSNLIQMIEDLCYYYRFLGRTRVAFVGPATAEDLILQRMLAAYAAHAARNDLPNLSVLLPATSNAADQLAANWKQYRGDLGIICYDDAHALRLMTAMHKIGLNAPGDYQIIGHNDTEASHYSDPPLTTISQDFSMISKSLLKNALALGRGRSYHAESLPASQLLIRSTCGGKGRINDQLKQRLEALSVEEAPPDHFGS